MLQMSSAKESAKDFNRNDTIFTSLFVNVLLSAYKCQ